MYFSKQALSLAWLVCCLLQSSNGHAKYLLLQDFVSEKKSSLKHTWRPNHPVPRTGCQISQKQRKNLEAIVQFQKIDIYTHPWKVIGISEGLGVSRDNNFKGE